MIYRMFEEKKDMLKARDFWFIRNDLHQASTSVMAKLLGWSPATISSYENGSLQSKQHDIQMKAILDPRSMKRAFYSNRNDIEENTRNALDKRISFLLDTIKSRDLLLI